MSLPRPSIPQGPWFLATLAFAPAAFFVYVLLEWIFLTTGASPMAGLALGERLLALVKGPLPLLVPLFLVQAAASLLSLIHARLRVLAVVPAAMVLGLLTLLLIDNFTYTVLGFGVLTSGPVFRVVYVVLLLSLIAIIGWRGWERVAKLEAFPAFVPIAGAACAVLILTIPAMRVQADPLEEAVLRHATVPVQSGAAEAPETRSRFPNILLLSADGLEAPYLSLYGYERPTTPYLETLAQEALVFDNAFSNVGRTHGSLITMLTGRLPTSTKVTFPPTVLRGDDAYLHLPGLLKAQGYRTLQLGMRHFADAEDANLLGGFDAANYRWEDVIAARQADRPDEGKVFRIALIERAETRILHALGLRSSVDGFAHVEGRREDPYWTDERRVSTLLDYVARAREPWFVQVHLIDTHCCSPQPNNTRFRGHNPEAATQRDLHDDAIYEADGHIRTIVEALRSAGKLDRTLLVITSDHSTRWETKARMPLLIRLPEGSPTGRVGANAQLADIAPTVLDYLDMAVPAWMDGVSLLDWGSLEPDRPVFGLSAIAPRKLVAFRLSSLFNSGPPNFGATSATLIAGNRWYELSLVDGRMFSSRVAGHTRPDASSPTEAEARQLLTDHLERHGFQIGDGRRAVEGE